MDGKLAERGRMPFVAANKKLPPFLRIEKEGEECLADLHKEKVWEGGRQRRGNRPTDGLGSPFKPKFWVRSDAQNRSHSLAETYSVVQENSCLFEFPTSHPLA